MQSDFAVLAGSKEFLLFSVANADVFVVDDETKAGVELKKLAAKYKFVIISENFAELLGEQIAGYDEKPYPIILCLPESKKSNGFALKNLVKKTKNSLGLDIFKENLWKEK